MATVETVTTEQMLAMSDADRVPRELIAGEIRESPMPTTAAHGRTVIRVGQVLSNFIDAHPQQVRGTVLGGDCAFRIERDPDTTIGIDVAFVSAERLDPENVPDSFVDLAPDLAVEVISRSQMQEDIDDRVKRLLVAGVRLIWLVNPRLRTVTVIRSATEMQLVTEAGELDGEPVLPGLSCKVAELFR